MLNFLFKNAIKFFRKDKSFLFLLILAIVFVFVYSYLYFSVGGRLIFNSPDETANYFFTEKFSKEGQLKQYEDLSEMGNHNIHPRSVKVYDNYLVPGSFLGMILSYGLISKLLGAWIIIFLTPILTSISALFLYKLLENIFNKRQAFFASVLFLINPAVWYFSSRSMFHNMLFIDLLIITLYFIIDIFYKKSVNRYTALFKIILIGFLSAMTLMVRTSEIIWISVLAVLAVLIFRKAINLKSLIIIIIVLFLTFVPVLFINKNLYGDYFKTGYSVLETNVLPVEVPDDQIRKGGFTNENIISKKLRPIFHFGVRPRTTWNNFYNYYIKMFWYLNIFLLAGIILFLKKWKDKKKEEKFFLFVFLFLVCYLSVYYGSWKLYDNINNNITINNSYVRYWLVIHLFSLPFIALALENVWTSFKKYKINFLIVGLLFLSFLYFSGDLVYKKSEDSLFSVKKNLKEYNNVFDQVGELTENNSIIITSRSDKIFFPKRRVMVGIHESIPFLADLIKEAPVYYYEALIDRDLEYLNNKKLSLYNISLKEVKEFENGFKLFRVE